MQQKKKKKKKKKKNLIEHKSLLKSNVSKWETTFITVTELKNVFEDFSKAFKERHVPHAKMDEVENVGPLALNLMMYQTLLDTVYTYKEEKLNKVILNQFQLLEAMEDLTVYCSSTVQIKEDLKSNWDTWANKLIQMYNYSDITKLLTFEYNKITYVELLDEYLLGSGDEVACLIPLLMRDAKRTAEFEAVMKIVEEKSSKVFELDGIVECIERYKLNNLEGIAILDTALVCFAAKHGDEAFNLKK